MASYYRLGSGLGAAFNATLGGGGDAVQNAAYGQQLRQNLQDALLQSRVGDEQAMQAAWAAEPQSLETMGVAPGGQGAAYANTLRATGSRINELGQFWKQALAAKALQAAAAARTRGDTGTSNFELAAAGAKPLQYTRIAANTAYDPNQSPLSQAFRTTPYGQAALAQKSRTANPKTFVGGDGVLRIAHPDGSTETVKDGRGQPILADDVKTAASVYRTAYGAHSFGAPKFLDWYQSAWPKLRMMRAVAPPAAPVTVPAPMGAPTPGAGMAAAQANILKALQAAQVPIDPGARKVGAVYHTPRGPMKWTGTGWLRAGGPG